MKKSLKILLIVLVSVSVVSLAIFGTVTFFVIKGLNSDEKETETSEFTTAFAVETVTKVTAADGFAESMTSTPEEAVTNSVAGEVDYLATLDEKEIELLNLFLSNFSEAFVTDLDTADQKELIDFIYLNTKINYSAGNIIQVEAEDAGVDIPADYNNHIYMTEEYVRERMNRFFGVELINQSSDCCYYKDGKYYVSSADGDQYWEFSKVTKATKNADGTITVEFDAYYFDVFVSRDQPDRYKGIGNENIDPLCCRYIYSGTAVLSEADFGEGYANYRLISLHKNK